MRALRGPVSMTISRVRGQLKGLTCREVMIGQDTPGSKGMGIPGGYQCQCPPWEESRASEGLNGPPNKTKIPDLSPLSDPESVEGSGEGPSCLGQTLRCWNLVRTC